MTLAQLRAQQGTVDREALLGRLMWYSVPEATMLDYDETIRELGSLGLTTALPKPPREHDVFRRVTKEAERRKEPHKGSSTMVENWMVRDVAGNREDTITRRIVVEVVDPQGHTLNYQQIADMKYVRPTAQQTSGHLEFDWLNGHDDQQWPVAQQMIDQVGLDYARWQGKLAHASVRHWIQTTIMGMGATPARVTGGIYFLEERHADKVEALEDFVAKHLPVGGECHSVEIPDNKKQREMVHKAIERETIGAIEDITAEVQECRREGKLTSKKFLDIQKRVTAVDRKMGGYMRLLEKDSGAISARLNLLRGLADELSPLQAKITRKRKPKTTRVELGEDAVDVIAQAIVDHDADEATPERPVHPVLAQFMEQ